MMKRNYFGKLLAIAMIFAGFSLTSCDKNDNAIINGQVFEPSSYQFVDGGAVVKANSPAEVSRMIIRLRQDILKAAEKKRPLPSPSTLQRLMPQLLIIPSAS